MVFIKPSALQFLSLIIFSSVVLISCFKGDVMPLQATVSNTATGSGQRAKSDTLYRGIFSATSGITIMGVAKIFRDSTDHVLQLDSFAVSAGPDLKVYLAKEYPPVNFINLGSLQYNSGSQLYKIPAGVNFSEYSYVLIHCQQYNHLFGYASLK